MYTRLLIAAGLIAAINAQSQTVFSDNFNSYNDGALVGQGTWTQNGTSTTSPIQVNGGKVLVGATGQDVNAPLSTPLSWDSATDFAFNFGATINVSSVATGDYFLHWSPATGSTVFISRLFAKSDGAGGYLLGYVETSGTGASQTYGTQSLSLNQDYDVVIKYHANAGALNDTADVFVNGNLYLTDAWTSALAETTTFGAVNLRQGGGTSSAPIVTVDNMFVEIVAVPEPASMALIGLGMAGLLIFRRRN